MKIKWGILGSGWIADKFVLDFKLVDNGEVVAVGASKKEKAEAFASRLNIPQAYGSYNELVQDTAVEIIYIATTHNFHFEHAKLCLENNKHVLCEKPITVNASELKQLQGIAEDKGLFLMEAMWTPFLPAVEQAVEWVKEGRIGKVGLIQANFGFPASPEFAERLFNPNLAGGALLDVGIYPLTIIEMFAQSDIKVMDVQSKFTQTGVDESLAIQMEYENGIYAQMACSISNRFKNNAFISGSKGMIEITDFWMSKKAKLTVGEEVINFEDESETMGYNFEVVAVNNSLLQGKLQNDLMPTDRSMKMMKLMDQIREVIGLKYPFE